MDIHDLFDKYKPEKVATLTPVKETPKVKDKKFKFLIGEKVKVINEGLLYGTYEDMAKQMKAKHWKSGRQIRNNMIGHIENVGIHPAGNLLYLFRDVENQNEYVMAEEGLIKIIR